MPLYDGHAIGGRHGRRAPSIGDRDDATAPMPFEHDVRVPPAPRAGRVSERPAVVAALFGPELHGFRSLASFVRLGLERNPHALREILKTGLLQRGDVNEDIVPASVRLDEAEPFLFIKEFYGPSLTHLATAPAAPRHRQTRHDRPHAAPCPMRSKFFLLRKAQTA
jgi:hypothetical protein